MNDADFQRTVLLRLDKLSDEQVRTLDRITRQLEQLATTPAPVAVKRAVAAKMMGVSLAKLVRLIRAGKVKTAEDEHLVPVAEVKRFCAPKVKRQRRPSVGYRARMKHVDGSSDEALELATKAIRKRRDP